MISEPLTGDLQPVPTDEFEGAQPRCSNDEIVMRDIDGGYSALAAARSSRPSCRCR